MMRLVLIVVVAVQSCALGAHANEMSERAKLCLNPVVGADDFEAQAAVELTAGGDVEAVDVKIDNDVGNLEAAVERAVTRAIQRCAPYPVPSAGSYQFEISPN